MTQTNETQAPTGQLSLSSRATCAVAGMTVLAQANNLWRRLLDCQAALIALSDEKRTDAASEIGSRLAVRARDATDNFVAPGQENSDSRPGRPFRSATLRRARQLATGRARRWLGIPERFRFLNFAPAEADAELFRDAALLIDHPTLLSLAPMQKRMRAIAKSLARADKYHQLGTKNSQRLLEKSEIVLKAIARGCSCADELGNNSPAIGATDLRAVVELAPFVTASRFLGSFSRGMSTLQAWSFLLFAITFAFGETAVAFINGRGNFLGAAAFMALAVLGPGIVVYELARPDNRHVWIPRWAVIRSCVLTLIVAAFFLWLSTRSADPWPTWCLLALFVTWAIITLVIIDGRRLFSQAPISGLVSSLLAASSVLTFLYTNQYKERTATPLLTTTATLTPETLPQGLTANAHRLVLQASISIKNDGDATVQVVGSLYRVDGTSAIGAPLAKTLPSTDIMTDFDPTVGSSSRFSEPTGVRLAGTSTPKVLIQADELIPMNVFLLPKETWSTTFTVTIDATVLSSVRLATEVMVGAQAHLKLGGPVSCAGSDTPHLSYRCWYRQIEERSFVEQFVLRADRIYLYVSTGDQLNASEPDVPSIFVDGEDIASPTSPVYLGEELYRRYGLNMFTTAVEWAP